MHWNSVRLGCALVTIIVSPVLAVLRNEAYRIDYHHALVGSPLRDNTFFYQPSVNSKATLLYTLSEKLVLGAVNPRDGSLVWRQDLSNGVQNVTAAASFLRGANGTNIVVSAVGDRVQAWEAANGRLVWEWKGKGSVRSLSITEIEGAGFDPICVMEDSNVSRISRINIINGKMVWEVVEDSKDLALKITSSTTSVFYLSLSPSLLKGYKTVVTKVDPVTAAVRSHSILSSESEVSSQNSILHIGSKTAAPVIVWADGGLKKLKMSILGWEEIQSFNVPSQGKDSVREITVHAPSTPAAPDHFLVHYQTDVSSFAEVYHVDITAGKVVKAFDLPRLDERGWVSAITSGAKVFFARHTEKRIELFASTSSDPLQTWSISPDSNSEATRFAISELVPRSESSFAIRSSITTASGDWKLFQNGETSWVRSESLGGIVAAAWVDPPTSESLASALETERHQNVVSAYFHRAKRHLKDLEGLPDWARNVPVRILSSLTGGSFGTDEGKKENDSFGFRKIVVVATERGRLAALDSGSYGRPLWNVQVRNPGHWSKWDVTSLTSGDGLVFVASENGGHAIVNLTQGNILEYSETVPSGADPRAVLTVLKDGTLAGHPSSEMNTTIAVTRDGQGNLLGWSFGSKNNPALAWRFAVPPNEDVAITAHRPAHDPVASIGRPLGDRNVLYKYLSPNLILVCTKNNASATVSIHLLDSVSGRSLYSTTHDGIDLSQPISAVLSENWFAYSLTSDSKLSEDPAAQKYPKGHLLVISELYESAIPNNRGSLASKKSFSAIESGTPAPHVVSATYVLSASISHLSATSTRQGITPRSILAFCPSLAAVVAIPAPLLSPRRPAGREPTAAEREEGLHKYTPLLEISSFWSLSHERELLGIQGILSEPSKMESTSLVFSYGDLDIFGTRIAPIGAFDVLGSGFSRLQLVLTILVLAAGTGFLSPMVRKKQADQLWGN